jgi:riboflavin kinase/FMN adenylyltransferase
VEAHLLEFDGDLYGRCLRVELAVRLREERRFPDAAALARQIGDDISAARRVLEKA